jgi:hypothetical protein
MELAKSFKNVYVTKDKKYFHVAGELNLKMTKILNSVRKKYKLKEANNENV